MFDTLTDRLDAALERLKGKGKLSEEDVDEALREIRRALLEADVNHKVVRSFTSRVRERAVGSEVHEALNPGQQVIKIVNEELQHILGEESASLTLGSSSPAVIMLAGLQGSGKTTAAGKLAAHLHKKGRTPLLVAADLQRPAAVDQLEVLGERVGAPVYAPERGGDPDADPVAVARSSLAEATRQGAGVVIVDTAGRSNIDDEMMDQATRISQTVQPVETLFVIDAMIGQEAVTVAKAFQEAVDFSGVILSKLDGDARGGAALSVAEVTGRPIKFASVGEKLDEFEAFHPDRMASRILGMGDVLTLIEKAEETYTEQQQAELEDKLLGGGGFTLQDFLEQMQQVKKMGPLQGLLGMMPGVGKELKDVEVSEDDLKPAEAIIQSMTPEERRNPKILNGKRKRRIAAGAGRTPQEINELLRNFEQMQQMMQQLGGAGGKGPSAGDARQLAKAGGGDMDMSALMGQMSGGGQLPGVGASPPSGAGAAGGGGGGARPKNKRVPDRKKKKKKK
jgi:signal recognition particle subunit SRP54